MVVKEDAVDCTTVGMLLPEIHLWIRITFQMHSHLNVRDQVSLHIFATTSNRFYSLDDLDASGFHSFVFKSFHSLTRILGEKIS